MKTKWLFIITILTLSVYMLKCTYRNSLANESVVGGDLNLKELASTNFISFGSITKQFAPDCTIVAAINIPRTRYDLANMRTVVQIYNGSKDAGLSIPGFGGLKLGASESNLNLYYIETKIVNDTIVYGIGYSVHYLFKKVKKGINITNLPSISASVQLESSKTQVLYSLQTYGMIGNSLVRFFKPTINKNFDVEGFGVMQSSIDGIQNILGDTLLSKSVRYSPEIIKFVKPSDLN
jgi:hypothetical protein